MHRSSTVPHVGPITTERSVVGSARDLLRMSKSKKRSDDKSFKIEVTSGKLQGQRLSKAFHLAAQGATQNGKVGHAISKLDIGDSAAVANDEISRHIIGALSSGNASYFLQSESLKLFFEMAAETLTHQDRVEGPETETPKAPSLQSLLDTIYRHFDEYKAKVAETIQGEVASSVGDEPTGDAGVEGKTTVERLTLSMSDKAARAAEVSLLSPETFTVTLLRPFISSRQQALFNEMKSKYPDMLSYATKSLMDRKDLVRGIDFNERFSAKAPIPLPQGIRLESIEPKRHEKSKGYPPRARKVFGKHHPKQRTSRPLSGKLGGKGVLVGSSSAATLRESVLPVLEKVTPHSFTPKARTLRKSLSSTTKVGVNSSRDLGSVSVKDFICLNMSADDILDRLNLYLQSKASSSDQTTFLKDIDEGLRFVETQSKAVPKSQQIRKFLAEVKKTVKEDPELIYTQDLVMEFHTDPSGVRARVQGIVLGSSRKERQPSINKSLVALVNYLEQPENSAIRSRFIKGDPGSDRNLKDVYQQLLADYKVEIRRSTYPRGGLYVPGWDQAKSLPIFKTPRVTRLSGSRERRSFDLDISSVRQQLEFDGGSTARMSTRRSSIAVGDLENFTFNGMATPMRTSDSRHDILPTGYVSIDVVFSAHKKDASHGLDFQASSILSSSVEDD